MVAEAAAPRFSIHLLGGFRVERNGVPVPEAEWRRRKSRTLLKILALAPMHRLSRDRVLEWLWPDLSPEAGTNNLHKVMHLTRRVLEPEMQPGAVSTYLKFEDDFVSLGPVWVDLIEFERAAARAEQSGEATDVEAALRLYTGSVLPEDLYEEWSVHAREVTQRRAVGLWLSHANRLTARGDLDGAAEAFHRILEIDPAHEEAHRGLVLTYARQGRRHEAIRQYQRCRELLQQELGVEPLPETVDAYERVLSGKVAAQRTKEEGAQTVRLVGRDTDLDALEDHLDAAAVRGRAVFLGGESGIGKTRLCQAFMDLAAQRGVQTMRGGCHEGEGQLPYLPLVEAFRDFLAAQAEERRQALLARWPELNLLVPDRTAFPQPGVYVSPDAAHDVKRRLFESVVDLLKEVCASAPCVLLIEDAHAADEATLQLLHYLARRAREIPLLLLVTFREDEVDADHPLAAAIAELLLQGIASRRLLGPLTPADMATLASDLLGGHSVDRDILKAVYDVTEGNPLFTQEVLRNMQQEGTVLLTDGRWHLRPGAQPTPSKDLSDLLTRRLSRPGEKVRTILSAASVAGRAFSFRLLQAATGEAEMQLLDALDAAIAARLVEETENGYQFRHPLLRESLYSMISRHRRGYLHRLVGAALQEQGGHPPEVLAHHWYYSDKPERAVEPLVQAGDRARAVYANDQAVEHYRRAIDVLEASPSPGGERLTGLYQRLGELHQIMADAPASLAAYERALMQTDDPIRRAAMRRSAAYVCITAGESDRAQGYLDAALRDLTERRDPVEASRVYYHLSQIAWHRERFEEAFTLAEQALQLAEEAGIPGLTAQGYEMLALACHSLGEWQKGLSFVQKRADLAGGPLDVPGIFDLHL